MSFLGHAQRWWANIDRAYRDDPAQLYPTGPVTPGGLTDRYLSDYANCYGDLSAGSGLNALTRDEGFTRDFLTRHQDKLIFGSDCSDADGSGPKCQGAQTIAAIRRLASRTPSSASCSSTMRKADAAMKRMDLDAARSAVWLYAPAIRNIL